MSPPMTQKMESIHEVRMRKYMELQREFADRPDEKHEPERGRLQRFGAFVGISDRYLSHVNNGRKNIGDDTARKVELAFGKPRFWMDTGDAGVADTGEEIITGMAIRAWRKDPIATHAALMEIIARQ